MSEPNEEPTFQDLLEEFRRQVEEDETPKNDGGDSGDTNNNVQE